MRTLRTIRQVRSVTGAARKAGKTVGLVPTMGALHAGHASLIDAARKATGFVVVSIFVNPTQFGPNEDFSRYPRTPEKDLALCRKHGADAVFIPSVEEMYPAGAGTRGPMTTVSIKELGDHLCGASRPGHFTGVCTVVSKLFNIVQPDRAFFGAKDYQQATIIRRMAADLDFPVEIVVCPTVREPDGLAMSSRNAYLSPEHRGQAPALHAALRLARDMILTPGQEDWKKGGREEGRRGGKRRGPASSFLPPSLPPVLPSSVPPGRVSGIKAADVIAAISDHIRRHAPSGVIDYVEVVDARRLCPVENASRGVCIALAVKFGSTRLIDNIVVD
ncbi:MAG: pantoate--beta-alanine ligase [Phycisphaerae bacterium]